MRMNLFAHFLEETLSLSPGFWEFLLAMHSSLYAKYLPSPPLPPFYMFLGSTLELLLLHGDGVQPHADSYPDHLH